MGLRASATAAIPGRAMSAINRPRPVSRSGSSTRFWFCPISGVLVVDIIGPSTRSRRCDLVGAEATFFEDLSSSTEKNDFVNQLRDEIRDWRGQGYPGTAL